jgi:hypothetical protein
MHRGFAAFRATGGMPFAMFWYYLACGLGRSGRPQENFKWWRTDLLPSRRPDRGAASQSMAAFFSASC